MLFITAIGGANGQLLEQNAQVMDQISANFRAFKVNLSYHLVLDMCLFYLHFVLKYVPYILLMVGLFLLILITKFCILFHAYANEELFLKDGSLVS